MSLTFTKKPLPCLDHVQTVAVSEVCRRVQHRPLCLLGLWSSYSSFGAALLSFLWRLHHPLWWLLHPVWCLLPCPLLHFCLSHSSPSSIKILHSFNQGFAALCSSRPSLTRWGLCSPILAIPPPDLELHSWLAPNHLLNHSPVCQSFPLLQISPPRPLSSSTLSALPWWAANSWLDGIWIPGSYCIHLVDWLFAWKTHFRMTTLFLVFWPVSTLAVIFQQRRWLCGCRVWC